MRGVLKSAEECARRWAEASSQACPRDQSQYDWALGFATVYLRKVTRKANRQALVTLSAAMLREAGLENSERVIVLPLPEGGLLVRGATVEDAREAHARYAASPQPCFPDTPALADLPEVEKLCPQCGLTFRTRQRRRVYCESCKHQRSVESARASWHRKGKLRQSYRRKLKASWPSTSHPVKADAFILPRQT